MKSQSAKVKSLKLSTFAGLAKDNLLVPSLSLNINHFQLKLDPTKTKGS